MRPDSNSGCPQMIHYRPWQNYFTMVQNESKQKIKECKTVETIAKKKSGKMLNTKIFFFKFCSLKSVKARDFLSDNSGLTFLALVHSFSCIYVG